MLLSHQEDSMGRRGYPPEFRQRVLDLVAAGRRVGDIARDLGISDQTVYSWRRQERMDQGIEPGLTSVERAELAAARRRIRELEAELAIHRKAAAQGDKTGALATSCCSRCRHPDTATSLVKDCTDQSALLDFIDKKFDSLDEVLRGQIGRASCRERAFATAGP